ncbi:MAG: hypothetical protein QGD94_10715, partial [Planctomycetia bacterium]|nr:hypothetical protein [Planctomycetia bacterium]
EKGDIRRGPLAPARAGSLEAADVLGAPVGIWDGRRLVVPVGEAPIYIYARGMKAKKLAKALGRARVVPLEPATDEKGKR